MTGWNLPPGISGNEYEIAGADEMWNESLWCDECDRVTLFTCERYRGDFSAICEVCDHEHPTWSEEREQFEDNFDDEPEDREEEGLLVDGCAS